MPTRTYHMLWHFKNGGLYDKTAHRLDIGHVFLEDKGNMNRGLMPDGLHPTQEGYRVCGKAKEPAIRKFVVEDPAAINPSETNSRQ